MRKVYNVFKSYNSNGPIESIGSNAIMIKNEGNVLAKLNGQLSIGPGDAQTIAQVSADVMDNTQYDIQFEPANPLSTGTTQLVVVVRIGISS